ncbi:ATPase, T2SS/T4P/T4SS family [Pseudomonadota bacterium]
MIIDIVDINLETLKPYLLEPKYTDLSIHEEGYIWCKSFGGYWERIENQNITKIYLQGLFRLIAIECNKEINDIDNFRENLDIKLNDEIHRANIIFGKSKKAGFGITIRLKRNHEISLDDFIIEESDKKKIIQCVKDEKNILISGGIGTGKTTFLNSLLKYVSNKENKRIITVENASEINLSDFPHNYPFIYEAETEEHVFEVFNDCLRSSPDILILGEIRKENAKVFLNFINAGHDGTFSTVHASSPMRALTTIANYITSQHQNEKKEAIRDELELGLSCVIQLKKTYENGKPQVMVSQVEYFGD